MRIIVCGSHTCGVRDVVFERLDYLASRRDITFVATGAAAYIDTFATEWAIARGLEHREWPVTKDDWRRFGLAAGPRRNQRMFDESHPDGVVAFPGGNGTWNMCQIALRNGIQPWFPFGKIP